MAKPRALIPLLLIAALLIAAASYGIATSQSPNGQHDTDGDRLIEISNLEQLNAIRYDLDGDGMPDDSDGDGMPDRGDAYAAAFPGTVCESQCHGYELTRPLDFAALESYASTTVNAKWTTGAGWLPIGVSGDARFYAIFDGNGHTVSNLYINRTTELDDPGVVGLFGYAVGTIRNVGIINVDVTGGGFAGGLVGYNYNGTISNSYATGNVSNVLDNDSTGGLVGYNHNGTISDSYATGNVSGVVVGGLVGWNGDWSEDGGIITGSYATSNVSGISAEGLVGGLVGRNWATITGSYATGTVSGSNAGGLVGDNGGIITDSYATNNVSGDSAGGLVGRNSDTITNSYATGNASGDSAGGLAGSNSGTITASYATGNLSGGWFAGGLAGENSGTITTSYAIGNVSGSSPYKASVGGLAGSNSGTITTSYATGNVSGYNSAIDQVFPADEALVYAGGLVGFNTGAITTSYAIGNASSETLVSGETAVGGLVGVNGSEATIHASYWNTQTSGLTTGFGSGNPNGAAGKTTAELQSPTGYTGIYAQWNIDWDNADGDFDPATGGDDHWDFGASNQYPVLKADFDGDGSPSWWEFGPQIGNRPTPTPTPTPIPTPTPTPTPTSTPTPMPTLTPTPTPEPTPTPTPAPTPTPTHTPTPEPTNTPTPTPTATPPPPATNTPEPMAAMPATAVSPNTPAAGPAATPTPQPAPAAESGGGCNIAPNNAPPGAPAGSLLLLLAPLAMLGGLKFHRSRRSGPK